MPAETRYMRSDQHTVNGLTAYILGLSNTTAAASENISRTGIYNYCAGVRVWKRTSGGTETEITAGSPAAVVQHSGTGTVLLSATWNCPGSPLNSTDAIVVRVYHRIGTDVDWTLAAEFTTEQLGASSLDSATWTVYYNVTRTEQYLPRPPYFITAAHFAWGNDANPSRIENFTWSYAVVVAKKHGGDGIVWYTT